MNIVLAAILAGALTAAPNSDAVRAERHFQTALKLLKRDRSSDAALELQASYALDPTRADAYELLGSLGLTPTASPSPRDPALPSGGGLGSQPAKLGEGGSADAELRTRLASILSNARAAYRDSDEPKAREAWRLALELEPANAEAQAGLERLEREAYRADKDQPFDKLVAQLYTEALREARKERFVEAKAKLDEALALNPEQAQVRALLAETASGAKAQGGKRQAQALLKDGERWLGEGEAAKAAAAFSQALGLDPELAGAQAGLAKVKAATLNQVQAVLAQARAAEKAGDLKAAQRHYELALALDPAQPDAKEGLARASSALRQGHLSAAQRREADRLYNLGVEAWQAGDLAAAAAQFRAALQASPADAEARKALEAVQSKLAQAVDKDRKDAGELLKEGKKLEERGAPEEALSRYERALAKDKASREAGAAVERLRAQVGSR